MTTPILWSWQLSPFAGKVRVAAARRGVELDLIEIDPVKRPPRLRELNPTNRVPVLQVGDVAVRESGPICEWLEETGLTGPSLWPEDPLLRARSRGLARWVDDEMTGNFFLSFRKQAFGLEPSDPPDIVEKLRARLQRRWSVLDGLLGATDGPWLDGGAEPRLADLCGMAIAVRLPQWGPELAPPAELTRATAWLEALREDPLAVEIDRKGRPVPDDA